MAQETKPVIFRLPTNLIRQLTAAARAQGRSRNAEAVKRLQSSLRPRKEVQS